MDILSELSIRLYEPPLSALRDNGGIADLSNPLSVVMLLIDFETEVSMNGIADFIGNSTGLYANETVVALELIGCKTAAVTLKTILQVASAAGMTHEAIQADRAGLAPYTLTSFSELHGRKWDSALGKINQLCNTIDFEHILRAAEAFIANHRSTFETALV